MRAREKRAKGVILDSSKPFIPNLGCKRKIIVRSTSVSLLEVVGGILELLNAGKLATEIHSACSEYIIYPGTWMYSWCFIYKRHSTSPSTSQPRSPSSADLYA